jgi:hypothetical protein
MKPKMKVTTIHCGCGKRLFSNGITIECRSCKYKETISTVDRIWYGSAVDGLEAKTR